LTKVTKQFTAFIRITKQTPQLRVLKTYLFCSKLVIMIKNRNIQGSFLEKQKKKKPQSALKMTLKKRAIPQLKALLI